MTRVLDTDSDKLEVFNIGTGHGCSTKEIVDAFQKATGVKLNWTYAPRRAVMWRRFGQIRKRLIISLVGKQIHLLKIL